MLRNAHKHRTRATDAHAARVQQPRCPTPTRKTGGARASCPRRQRPPPAPSTSPATAARPRRRCRRVPPRRAASRTETGAAPAGSTACARAFSRACVVRACRVWAGSMWASSMHTQRAWASWWPQGCVAGSCCARPLMHSSSHPLRRCGCGSRGRPRMHTSSDPLKRCTRQPPPPRRSPDADLNEHPEGVHQQQRPVQLQQRERGHVLPVALAPPLPLLRRLLRLPLPAGGASASASGCVCCCVCCCACCCLILAGLCG